MDGAKSQAKNWVTKHIEAFRRKRIVARVATSAFESARKTSSNPSLAGVVLDAFKPEFGREGCSLLATEAVKVLIYTSAPDLKRLCDFVAGRQINLKFTQAAIEPDEVFISRTIRSFLLELRMALIGEPLFEKLMPIETLRGVHSLMTGETGHVLIPVSGRQELLKKSIELSKNRCISRMRSLGLDVQLATSLLECVYSEIPEKLIQSAGGVHFVTGDMGSGKSTLADQIFQWACNSALDSFENPVPIFLEASCLHESLDVKVNDLCKGLGTASFNGLRIVIDGADEIGSKGVEKIIAESMALSRTFPTTAVWITARSAPSSLVDLNHYLVPPLDHSAISSILSKVAGRDMTKWHYADLPANLKNSLSRPLMAILYGISLGKVGGLSYKSPGELFKAVTERCLGAAGVDLVHGATVLRELGKRITNDGLGSLPVREVIQARIMLQSGVVVERDGYITFTLPAFIEWAAAESLISEPQFIDELVGDDDRLHRWFDAIVFFASGPERGPINYVLSKLAATKPAFCSEIIESVVAVRGEIFSGSLTRQQIGDELIASLDSWRTGLAPLTELLDPTSVGGRPRPLGVKVEGTNITLGFYEGDEELPRVVEFGEGLSEDQTGQDWPMRYWTNLPSSAAWPSKWARETFTRPIGNLVRSRGLPCPPSLHQEYLWCFVRALNQTRRPNGPIPLGALIKDLTPHFNAVVSGNSDRFFFVDEALGIAKACLESGLTHVIDPYPEPDLPYGRWVWSVYSADNSLERARRMFPRAVTAYIHLIETWFPKSRHCFALGSLFPAEIRCRVIPGRPEQWINGSPTMSYFFEPAQSTSFDVQLASEGFSFRHGDAMSLLERTVRARPSLGPALSVTIHSGSSVLYSDGPATSLAYSWLWSDLQRCGLVSGIGPID